MTLGSVTLSASNAYTGGTTVNGTLTLAAANAAGTGPIAINGTGTLALAAAGAAGTNPISFGAVPGELLIVGNGDFARGADQRFRPQRGGRGQPATRSTCKVSASPPAPHCRPVTSSP